MMTNNSPLIATGARSRRREVCWMLGLSLVLGLLFRFVPGVDLWMAGLFYSPPQGFFSPDNWWLAIPYYGMPILSQLVLLVLLIGWLGGFVLPGLKHLKRSFGFLLLVALIGPHLLVGVALKDSMGRARPSDIQQFGGPLTFTPAFVLSDQCDKNCSFVSGHVASAAFFMAFGWLRGGAVRRRWLWAGTGFAAIMGLARMVQGGHFLSDVVVAYFAVYWSLWVAEWMFRWRRL